MPSYGLDLFGDLLEALRNHETPVIARSRDARTLLGLRSVGPDDDVVIVDALCAAAS
jgi:hypothetical protein